MKLVANRTRNWGSVPHAGASIVTYPDGRSTVRDELQHASLVIAKGAHARRLIRGWRGVHFEPVEDGAHWLGSGRVEQVAALLERSLAQRRINEARCARSSFDARG